MNPDAHYDRLLADHLRQEEEEDARLRELASLKSEIVAAILDTGSYTWGDKPHQTIGDCEMFEYLDYFALFTAAQPRNHTIAGRLLHDTLKEAAEKVAARYVEIVFQANQEAPVEP